MKETTLKATINLQNINFNIDLNSPLDISIPVKFNGTKYNNIQPNNYKVPYANALPYQDGQFIGSVAQGGNCNFDIVSIIPHCNGTHTECIGHITKEKQSINHILNQFHKICLVISVEPQSIQELNETDLDYYPYQYKNLSSDKVITSEIIYSAISSFFEIEFINNQDFTEIFFNGILIDSLAIRTLPNNDIKNKIDYMEFSPAYLTNDAMILINKLNIKNLLIDLPSVDRQFDDGKLSSHHIFWGLEQETNTIPINKMNDKLYIENFYNKTITEMIYIKDEILDGVYLLNLQIAPFELDASPSKPILFNIEIC